MLEREGISRFMDGCRARDLASPSIDSSWYLSRVRDPLERAAIDAEREFGRSMLVELQKSVHVMWDTEPSNLADSVDELFLAADWIGGKAAFGNAVIQREAREIALIGLGRLAADDTIPLEVVIVRQHRLFGGLNTTQQRRKILNREAGEILFPEGIESDDALRARWSAGWRSMLGDSRKEAKGREASASEAMGLPQRFFDARPCPRGAVSCWGNANHERLLGDFIDKSAFILAGLVKFREVVGLIPDSEERTLSGWPRLYIGFRDAWRRRVGVGIDRSVPYEAAVVVEQVSLGVFSRPRGGRREKLAALNDERRLGEVLDGGCRDGELE